MSTSAATGPFAGRTFIILNPAAGQDDPLRLKRLVGGAFAERDAPFDLVMTEEQGHATVLAREAVERGYRAVCVVGGDGTLAEVATALAGTELPLALIPRGTANQVAHNLGIPTSVERAVEIALNGTPTPMDIGRVDGRAFALVAGAGYDAAVMAAATRDLKERWGFAAYVFAAVKEALSATPVTFRIQADDRELEIEAVTVMLANVGELFTQFLPFGLALAPQPTLSWQDGLFDVVVVAPKGVAGLPAVLWRAARRQFGDERLLHFQAKDVRISAAPPIAVQIDGDPAGETPVSATAVAGGIRIMSP